MPVTALKDIARIKVNLTLMIHGRRSDGYHELDSIVAFADEGDRLTLEAGAPPHVRVTGPFAAALAGENLLDKTLALVKEHYPKLSLGAVTLTKNIPVAAGLGGGSADAAALLRLIGQANREAAAGVNWQALATGLGADVPVCMVSQAARMRGTGEKIEVLKDFTSMAAVIVNAPKSAVPHGKTARIFSALGARQLPPGFRPPPDTAGAAMTVPEIIAHHRNDLEPPARSLMPQVGAISDALGRCNGATVVRLSGAGPSCFALFPTDALAKKAAADIAAARPDWWVLPTMLG
jgi:4-diphosphocytidyl-2-C-methyl-D-erythritol kinase